MAEKWTPGPWLIADEIPLPYACKPRIYGCDMLIAEVGNSCIEDQQKWEANAVLMAASPSLYKALVYARRFLNPEEHDTDYIDSILAIARGD